MADTSDMVTDPPVTYEYIPPHGSKRKPEEQSRTNVNDRVPGVIYDDRSTYRQDFTDIKAPYAADLPWKPVECKLADREVRGTLPGYFGPEYQNPYSRLKSEAAPNYESAGAERMKRDIAEEVARQKEHDKVIPKPNLIMPELPMEKFTEYRSGYCKTIESESESLPDVKPITDGQYKYYHGADNFSYNSQHKNKAY